MISILQIALLLLNIILTAFLIYKNHKIMATFEQMQADQDAIGTALNNIATDVAAQTEKIDALQAQIDGMSGLTAEQVDALATGLAGIRSHAEAISTEVEGAPATGEGENTDTNTEG